MFQESVLIEPDESGVLFWLGKALMEISDYSHAIENLLKSNEIKFTPDTYYLIGKCY